MHDSRVLRLASLDAAALPRQPAASTADVPVRVMSWMPLRPSVLQEKDAKETKVLQMEATTEPQPCDLVKDEPHGVLLKPTLLQVLLIIGTSLATLQFGMAYSWPNALAGQLLTGNSTLLGHQLSLTPFGMDLVGSLMFAGATLATLPASWLVGKLGRRMCLAAPTLPTALSWALIAFAHNEILIYVGRFVAGIGLTTMMQSGKIYVAEISNISIRGMASALLETMKVLGFVVVVAVSISLSWYTIACANAVLMLVYGGVMLTVPESPNFLAIKGREEEARHVLRRIRGPKADVDAELAILKLSNQRNDGASGFAALFKRDMLKRVAVMVVLLTLRSLCGSEVITAHCTRMLLGTGVSLDPIQGTVMVNSAYLLGGLFLTMLVDRLGRRWTMVVSLTVVAVGYIVLGCYCYFFPAPSQPSLDIMLLSPLDDNATVSYVAELSDIGDASRLLPLFCFLTVAFGIGLGTANIPLVLVVEYFPTNVRAEGLGLCLTWLGAITTVVLQLYSVMVDTLTHAGVYWTFALAAVAAIVHTLCFIRETNKRNIG